MSETIDPGANAAPTGPVCPWCSVANAAGATTCASCGAALVDAAADVAVPGVNLVDTVAAAEAASSDRDRDRWIGRDRVIQAAIEDLTGTEDPYHQ